MKKFLFLPLSLAVATSASAGVNFKQTHRQTINKVSTSVKFEQKVKKDKLSDMKRVNKKQSFRTPITEQPEGELKSYIRSGQYD